jgi:hypothetical protein
MVVKPRKKTPQKRTRRYGTVGGGLVTKTTGEGPYVVEYPLYDSTGQFKKTKMPGSQSSSNRGWVTQNSAKRFKTLRGAIGFFERRIHGGGQAELYLWKNRNAFGKRSVDNVDYRRIFSNKTVVTDEEIERAIRKKIGAV